MNKNIENEKRLMLTFEQYEILMNDFSNDKSSYLLNQTNYYFDDEDLSLRDHHIVLRIRTINDSKYELTAKIKGKKGEGDTEINIPLSKEQAEEIINNPHFDDETIKEAINKATSKPVTLITYLKTIRLECPKEDHLLVIDKNEYSDIVDYNLEVEAANMEDANKYIHFYAETYHLTYNEKYLSKSRRAINRALELK